MIIGIDASRAFVKDPAGPEYYSWHLIKSLTKVDRKNKYLLYLRPNQKIDFKLPKNFKAKTLHFPHLWTQAGLAIETVLNPPAVIFVPSHTLPLLTRILRPQLPIVVTVHGLEGKYLPQSGHKWTHFYRNWSIEWAVRFAHRLIAVSNDTKNDIIKTYKISSNKIKVIHEGVDLKNFQKEGQAKTKRNYRLGQYILFVGTIQPRKNLVRLIHAFSRFSNKKRNKFAFENISLVIAGKLGWLYDKVLEAPSRFGVKDRVFFLGRVPDYDLPRLYKGAKAFVLPSLTEGFGLPILEAQAAGIPVGVSKAGALPEVAGDGALFFNPLHVEDITETLEKLLKTQTAKMLIKKGIENAKKFSWENTAYNTVKLLEEVGSRHR